MGLGIVVLFGGVLCVIQGLLVACSFVVFFRERSFENSGITTVIFLLLITVVYGCCTSFWIDDQDFNNVLVAGYIGVSYIALALGPLCLLWPTPQMVGGAALFWRLAYFLFSIYLVSPFVLSRLGPDSWLRKYNAEGNMERKRRSIQTDLAPELALYPTTYQLKDSSNDHYVYHYLSLDAKAGRLLKVLISDRPLTIMVITVAKVVDNEFYFFDEVNMLDFKSYYKKASGESALPDPANSVCQTIHERQPDDLVKRFNGN